MKGSDTNVVSIICSLDIRIQLALAWKTTTEKDTNGRMKIIRLKPKRTKKLGIYQNIKLHVQPTLMDRIVNNFSTDWR